MSSLQIPKYLFWHDQATFLKNTRGYLPRLSWVSALSALSLPFQTKHFSIPNIILFYSYLLRKHILFTDVNITHETHMGTNINTSHQITIRGTFHIPTPHRFCIAQFSTCEYLWNTDMLYESCLFILIHARLCAFLRIYRTCWTDLRHSQMFAWLSSFQLGWIYFSVRDW